MSLQSRELIVPELKYPAINIVHWPGKSTPACEAHTAQFNGLADVMGMPRPTVTPAPEGSICTNCENEEKAK